MKKIIVILIPCLLLIAVIILAIEFNPKLPVEPTTEIRPVTAEAVIVPSAALVPSSEPVTKQIAVQDPVQEAVGGIVLNATFIEEETDDNTETGAEEEYQEVQEEIPIQEDVASEPLVDTTDDSMVEDGERTEADFNESGLFLGAWTITAYCGCPECCGSWSGSPTASGAWPTEGWTVACGSLPFGSVVYIEGLGTRCVEDRGVYGDWIDVYFDDHNAADSFGMQSLEVYLIE